MLVYQRVMILHLGMVPRQKGSSWAVIGESCAPTWFTACSHALVNHRHHHPKKTWHTHTHIYIIYSMFFLRFFPISFYMWKTDKSSRQISRRSSVWMWTTVQGSGPDWAWGFHPHGSPWYWDIGDGKHGIGFTTLIVLIYLVLQP